MMIPKPKLQRPRPVRLLAAVRQRLRSSELWLIMLAVGVGAVAGLLAVFQARIAHGLQSLLYGLDFEERLSATVAITPLQALWLPLGGLALGLFTWAVMRRRPARLVDVVEANALYGGQLGLVDSAVVCAQTLLSNGVGASVGLEAAYAQAGGAAASKAGTWLRLRRHDMRILVGAGAGAALGAAFGAPLTGAFYAFEIVIGSYTPSAIAPVAAASLASVLTANALGGLPYSIHVQTQQALTISGYVLYVGLGLACAAIAVAIMQLVGLTDRLVRGSKVPVILRPALGGVLLGGLALISPQVLSGGHGALQLDLNISSTAPMAFLATMLALKTVASVISLGSGFRGGLFFASLFLGSLLGQLYARLGDYVPMGAHLAPQDAALVGMGALAVSVVGGPLTMSFLVLESTHDFGITAATLAAALVASSVVRERFGYSFSTWRLHLRGETIRSARDVGWMRTLTAGRMMRQDTRTIPIDSTVSEFRRQFPLGSTTRVIVLDSAGCYAGVIVTASAYADGVLPETTLDTLAISPEATLTPEMDIEAVMRTFDATETEDLAVVDADRRVLGLLAESYVARRYASELERQHMDLYGEARG